MAKETIEKQKKNKQGNNSIQETGETRPIPREDEKEDRTQEEAELGLGDEAKDMDIGELDLEGIEQSCAKKGKGYILQQQVCLLKKAILRVRENNQLGISLGSHKENKHKYEEPSKKMGRKQNKQRVEEVGRRMVESGQYPTIKVALGL